MKKNIDTEKLSKVMTIAQKTASVGLFAAGIATKNSKLAATGILWMGIDECVDIGFGIADLVSDSIKKSKVGDILVKS